MKVCPIMLDYLLRKLAEWLNEKTHTVDYTDHIIVDTTVLNEQRHQLQPHVPRKKLPTAEKALAPLPLYLPTPLPRPLVSPSQQQLGGMAKGRGTPHWVAHPGVAKPNAVHSA